MLHIGIHHYSVEGAILCYAEVMREAQRRLGEHRHPNVTMSGVQMADTLAERDAGDQAALRARSARAIARLASAEADFFLMPDNTAHIALEHPGPDLALPGLHIGEVVAEQAAAGGYRKVGVLGTNWTMRGPVYPAALGRRGIDHAVPDETMCDDVHRIILDELCLNRFEPTSIDFFRRVVDELAACGCDAVALVCTEIPLILTDENSALPTIDSTRLLAHAAVDVALGLKPMPTWRGGPVQE